jgi:hypothetical protein
VIRLIIVSLLILPLCLVNGAWAAEPKSAQLTIPARRLSTESPWFYVADAQVDLHESYSGYNPQLAKRFSHLTIGDKAIEMIHSAKKLIVASVFLFDNMYNYQKPPRDIVKELTDALIKKRTENDDLTIVVVLDPLNRAYAKRISPAVKTFTENGIDVFYSDLLTTKAASKTRVVEGLTHVGRVVDEISLGLFGGVIGLISSIPIPFVDLDGEQATPQMAAEALLLKANHRKLLVTDSGDTYEALVSSANPHNASIPSTNFALSVKGSLAAYIHNVIRKDAAQSIKLDRRRPLRRREHRFAHWHTKATRSYRKEFLEKTMPELPVVSTQTGTKTEETPIAVKFATEKKIHQEIIRILRDVDPLDEVRLQMFYLSEVEIIEEILNTAKRLDKPFRVLLDPNKDSFNKEKDGTPNRQVAAYLLEKAEESEAKLAIRWYSTHGEQNHAKIISVTNKESGKFILMTGSANWTGKNLLDINMESNLIVLGSERINQEFNDLFDLFWTNHDGMEYSLDYQAYQEHSGMNKWLFQEKSGLTTW